MIVRQAQPEDIREFPSLFHRAYSEYSMYCVRTPDTYSHFMKKLTIEKEHVLVVEEEGHLSGYIIMGIKYMASVPTLSIYEIAAETRESYDLLMARAEEIAQEKDAAFIDTIAPPQSEFSLYLVDHGFLESRAIATLIRVYNVDEVLSLFVKRAGSTNAAAVTGMILFQVDKRCMRVRLPEGIVDTGPAPLRVSISCNDLLSLLFRRVSVYSLVLRGKMRVTPLYEIRVVCAVIEYLSLDAAMMIPFLEML
jgi:predicted acetyltransferase